MKMNREGRDGPEEDRVRAKAATAIYLVGGVMAVTAVVIEGCF